MSVLEQRFVHFQVRRLESLSRATTLAGVGPLGGPQEVRSSVVVRPVGLRLARAKGGLGSGCTATPTVAAKGNMALPGGVNSGDGLRLDIGSR